MEAKSQQAREVSKRRLNVLLVAVVAWAAIFHATAQVPTQAWVNRFNGAGNSTDVANAVGLDTNGNVFVTGYCTGLGSGFDYATIAYSNNGVALWTNIYNGPGNNNDQAYALAVDHSGNVFVTGRSASSASPLRLEFLTIKYSNSGVPLWTNRFREPGTTGAHTASAILVATNGNVIVAGASTKYCCIAYSNNGSPLWTNYYGSSVVLFATLATDSQGNVILEGPSASDGSAYVTLKYSAAGVPLWTNVYSTTLSVNPGSPAKGMAVDSAGNILVAGLSGYTNDAAVSDFGFSVVKYSAAGQPLWTNVLRDTYAKIPRALAIGDNGSVALVGDGGQNSSYQIVSMAYSTGGTPLWTNRFSFITGYDRATGIAISTNQIVVIVGYSGADFASVAYSASGAPVWTNRYDGPANNSDQANALAVDSAGNIFVTGSSTGVGSGTDLATIKYSFAAALAPIPFSIQWINEKAVLTWTNSAFGLQASPNLPGIFTNIAGATSPYTNPVSRSEEYFRLISN